MKTFLFSLFFLFAFFSCKKTATNEVSKPKNQMSSSQALNKKENEKECDKGEEVLKKIEKKKNTLTLNNLESGCSLEDKEDSDLKF